MTSDSPLFDALTAGDARYSPRAGASERPDRRSWVERRPAAFVGRVRELEQLEEGFTAARSGLGQLFLFVGESGIGKTRLADVASQLAHADGALVLWGRCWQGGGAPLYWPWVQIVRSCIEQHDAPTIGALAGRSGSQIAQMAPELADVVPDADLVPPSDPEQARFDLFDAVTTFLRRVAAQRPLVLVLDDLHAADTSSLLLLSFLARELRGTRAVVVGAYREIEPSLSSERGQLVASIAREGRTLLLPGLGEQDVRDLVARAIGRVPSDALAARIHQATGGNPFFIDEAVRLLLGHRAPDQDAEAPLLRLPHSEGVRNAIRVRLEPLGEEDRRLLSIAAVLGKEFAFEALRRAADTKAGELLESLQRANACGVVVELPSGFARYRFAHELMRDSLYEELGATQRTRLHLQVAEALEEIYGDACYPHLAQLAHHFFEGLPASDPSKAVDYCERAGDKAMRLLAHEEAATRFESALQAMDLMEFAPAHRCELLMKLGTAQVRAGRAEEARASFEEAAARAERLGDDGQVVRIVTAAEDLGITPTYEASATKTPSRDEGQELEARRDGERRAALRRNGDYWVIAYAGASASVKDSKGLHYLAHLLANPNIEVHALELVSLGGNGHDRGSRANGSAGLTGLEVRGGIGDAGEVLDDRAKRAYKERLAELREDIEEAETFADAERAAKAKQEIDFLTSELSAAVGLGGRDRKVASAGERARVNVTKAIKASIKNIATYNGPLAVHLERTIKTGFFCSYTVAIADVDWDVRTA